MPIIKRESEAVAQSRTELEKLTNKVAEEALNFIEYAEMCSSEVSDRLTKMIEEKHEGLDILRSILKESLNDSDRLRKVVDLIIEKAYTTMLAHGFLVKLQLAEKMRGFHRLNKGKTVSINPQAELEALTAEIDNLKAITTDRSKLLRDKVSTIAMEHEKSGDDEKAAEIKERLRETIDVLDKIKSLPYKAEDGLLRRVSAWVVHRAKAASMGLSTRQAEKRRLDSLSVFERTAERVVSLIPTEGVFGFMFKIINVVASVAISPITFLAYSVRTAVSWFTGSPFPRLDLWLF